MQKVRAGHAALVFGLVAALALGSTAAMTGTAHADTLDQNGSENAKIIPWAKYSYTVKIYNDDTYTTETTYQIKVDPLASIEEAVNESLDEHLPENVELTGSMDWDFPGAPFEGAIAQFLNKCATITVHVKNAVTPIENISFPVVDERGSYLDTVVVEYQGNILDALTNRFGETYEYYTWLDSSVAVDKYEVALSEKDGWKIVAHEKQAPVEIEHKVTFDDGLSDTEDSIISVLDGETINSSDIPANPVREGYTFEGWFALDENGDYSETSFDFETPITSDLTLYAKWSENTEENPSAGEDQGSSVDTGAISNTDNQNSESNSNQAKEINLPQTSDSVFPYVIGTVAFVGALGAVVALIMRKRINQ